MGNICNSSQKKNKDAESEVSEGGENDVKKSEDKLKTEREEIQETECSENTGLIPVPNAINEVPSVPAATPQIDCDDTDEKTKTNMHSKIFGCPISSRIITKNKKIVIFILMSNKHKHEEQLKNVSQLFPKLWRYCKLKGFELTASFTHHEILSKGGSRPPRTGYFTESVSEIQIAYDELENYKAELSRHSNSYIIPVLFLGSSLGKMCVPLEIAEDHFQEVLSVATSEQSETLKTFYKPDNPSQPNHYSLAISSDLSNENVEKILKALIEAMPIHLKQIYLANAFEKVINDRICGTAELAQRCIWIQNGDEPPAVDDDQTIQADSSKRLNMMYSRLRDELRAGNTVQTVVPSDMQEELNCTLEYIFKSNVDSIFAEHNTKYRPSHNTLGMCRQILEEIEAVKRHSFDVCKYSTNTDAMDAVSKYIQNDSTSPFIVFGRTGDGKSALAADIGIKLNDWIDDAHLVLRFTNLTALSSELTSLLASIAEQLSILLSGEPTQIQYDTDQYQSLIQRLLDTSKLFLVIVIDSVDKIAGLKNFDWLPKISRPNLKIILTMTGHKDLQDSWTWTDLTKRGIPNANFYTLPTSIQPNLLKARIISKLPRLTLDDKDDDDPDKFNQQLFSALESDIDSKFLRILLVLISISTYGIYETDCLNIFQEHTNIDKIYALIIWSKFCWIMGPLLQHTDTIKVVDIKFLEAILKRYSEHVAGVREFAKRYYNNLPDSFTDDRTHVMSMSVEKFVKVPLFDLIIFSESRNKDNVDQYFSKQYFTDLSWMINKINATGCFQYLNDILQAEAILKTSSTGLQHIAILKQFLKSHMAQLNCDGSQLYTLLKQFLKRQLSKDQALEQNNFVKNWTDTMNQLQIVHLECLNSNNHETTNNEKATYNDVVSLKASGYYIAAISTNSDEICVWDVPNCAPIRKLKSVPQPSLLCSIKDFEAAVLCKREIKVIDLKEGQYKSTLKGVMNQKMPYFGLHDESHLACLSRNRMYVNLMNLQTGDCVTSFKAGEDRFLNSLIISGNGRILVCGDESQKPFSLLVWHLTQRRLLYDLRIPHHDLFTSLSAITYEGSYVSVVAKEITESGPNFIVVYDLQSGTLFQKLKPICNTVAIAISQANGCVIAGLENAEILIWDLVTGNCRHTLIGHNAPVTRLKLDPLGSCLLSGDSEGRDLSLRLWELSTGKSLAVFSPPQKTSSCEILDNGMFIILALQNVPELLILRLRNYDKTQIQSEQYSNEGSDCKIFNLSEV